MGCVHDLRRWVVLGMKLWLGRIHGWMEGWFLCVLCFLELWIDDALVVLVRGPVSGDDIILIMVYCNEVFWVLKPIGFWKEFWFGIFGWWPNLGLEWVFVFSVHLRLVTWCSSWLMRPISTVFFLLAKWV
jgi:hypothetical protein